MQDENKDTTILIDGTDTRAKSPGTWTAKPPVLRRGASKENIFTISHTRGTLSAFDETEEMSVTDRTSEQRGLPSAVHQTGQVETPQSKTDNLTESGSKTSDGRTIPNVSTQKAAKETSNLSLRSNSRRDGESEPQSTEQSGTKPESNETKSAEAETGTSSEKDSSVKAGLSTQANIPDKEAAHNKDSSEKTMADKKNSPEKATADSRPLEEAVVNSQTTSEVSVAQKEQGTTKREQEDTVSSERGPAVKQHGSNGKMNATKPDKRDNTRDADPKTARRKSPANSKSPRAVDKRFSKVSLDRTQKTDDKSDKSENKINKNIKLASTKLDSPRNIDSKTKKPEDEGKSKPPTEKTTETTEPRSLTKEPNPTNKQTPAPKTPKPDPANMTTANGTIHTDAKTKPTKPAASREDQDQQKKAHSLLGRTILKRATSLENKQENKSTDKTSAQPAPNDLNSSAGSKSLGGKSITSIPPQPGLPHKTQSIQSLAVPGPGVGGSGPTDGEDRASLGSRRDSVSRKSVDYRLHNSEAVVAGAEAGGGEEKGKSVMMHDDSMIRAAIPALPVPVAVLCLLCNILLPGSGTIISGMALPCCGKPRLTGGSNKGDGVAVTVCINLCVGAAQLGTVTFFLVGWFWALAWGVKMVILAVEHRAEQRQQREKDLQALALRAFGSPGNVGRAILPPV
ncbi:uncharacterized protein LOC143296379 [Babylonia areolata]|uniref:uncharacterized protein LOC143296379 n=1 Tax=Babylonia areolata TaxID=304850 RepID=UPI003FD015B4